MPNLKKIGTWPGWETLLKEIGNVIDAVENGEKSTSTLASSTMTQKKLSAGRDKMKRIETESYPNTIINFIENKGATMVMEMIDFFPKADREGLRHFIETGEVEN